MKKNIFILSLFVSLILKFILTSWASDEVEVSKKIQNTKVNTIKENEHNCAKNFGEIQCHDNDATKKFSLPTRLIPIQQEESKTEENF